MKAVPSLRITRFAQLKSGDLFLWRYEDQACVAMVAVDPTQDGDKRAIVLGPKFPTGSIGPTLVSPRGTTAIFFDNEYVIRLPVHASGWLDVTPPQDVCCILVTEQGAYFRVNSIRSRDEFRPCYVNVATGLICASDFAYREPGGVPAFAVHWEIATDESEPRIILAYPNPRSPAGDHISSA
jgi:hypothetical protein